MNYKKDAIRNKKLKNMAKMDNAVEIRLAMNKKIEI